MEASISLVKAYQDNREKIKEISEQRDKFQEQEKEKIYKFKHKYYEKIRALEKERDNKSEVLENQKDAKKEKANKEISERHKAIEKVERILYFLGLDTGLKTKEWLNFDEKTIHVSRDREIGLIEKFYQDEFLKAVIVIYENDKPKNKYSLVVVGRCRFGGQSEDRHILELPRAYTCVYTKDNGYFNIEIALKDLPTVEELKIYLEKIKRKLLKDFMYEYQTTKLELLEVKEKYKIDDFKKIIKYRCKKCDFFLTEKDAGNYSINDNKCPRCKTEGFGWWKIQA